MAIASAIVASISTAPLGADPRVERRLAARWEEIAPAVLIAIARQGHIPAARDEIISAHRALHRSRVLTLLAAGISWRAIRSRALDSPRTPTDEFEFLLRKYGNLARGQRRRYVNDVRLARTKRQLSPEERREQTAPAIRAARRAQAARADHPPSA